MRTNVSSLEAQRNLAANQQGLDGAMRKLSSGYRITRSADDAAGLAISEKLRSRIIGTHQAIRNANDGISAVQTADGGLAEMGDIVQRIRELAVQSANGVLTTADYQAVHQEVMQLEKEVDAIADRTRFNGIPLLGADAGVMTLQVGAETGETIDVSFTAMTMGETLSEFKTAIDLYLDPDNDGDPGSQDNYEGEFTPAQFRSVSQGLISSADGALGLINGQRAQLGAVQNRLEHAISVQQVAADNLAHANSRIRDVDVAAESAQMARMNILAQSAVTVLTQANQQPQLALKLLGG